jgi:hypothetical protein
VSAFFPWLRRLVVGAGRIERLAASQKQFDVVLEELHRDAEKDAAHHAARLSAADKLVAAARAFQSMIPPPDEEPR